MDLLAGREHGREELMGKLLRRFGDEYSAALADELERLAGEGLQCDQRFVQGFLRSRLERRQGPLRIRRELILRGIDSAQALAALQTVEEERWQALATEALQSRYGDRDDGALERREWARRAGFLQRRGFTTEQEIGRASRRVRGR